MVTVSCRIRRLLRSVDTKKTRKAERIRASPVELQTVPHRLNRRLLAGFFCHEKTDLLQSDPRSYFWGQFRVESLILRMPEQRATDCFILPSHSHILHVIYSYFTPFSSLVKLCSMTSRWSQYSWLYYPPRSAGDAVKLICIKLDGMFLLLVFHILSPFSSFLVEYITIAHDNCQHF